MWFNLKWMVDKRENLVGSKTKESLLGEERHDGKMREVVG